MSILAQQYPVYQPAMRIVANIVNLYVSNEWQAIDQSWQSETNTWNSFVSEIGSEFVTIVTTTFAHQYKNGAIVRINIPPGYGMQEINQMYAPIIVLSTTTFSMPIDSSRFSLFSVPISFPNNQQNSTVTPVGEISPLLNSSVMNVLPYSAT